jgi:hypothetical protein
MLPVRTGLPEVRTGNLIALVRVPSIGLTNPAIDLEIETAVV